jgi:hypothetical protein
MALRVVCSSLLVISHNAMQVNLGLLFVLVRIRNKFGQAAYAMA